MYQTTKFCYCKYGIRSFYVHFTRGALGDQNLTFISIDLNLAFRSYCLLCTSLFISRLNLFCLPIKNEMLRQVMIMEHKLSVFMQQGE